MVISNLDINNGSKDYFSAFNHSKSENKQLQIQSVTKSDTNNQDEFSSEEKTNNDDNKVNKLWYYIGGAAILALLGFIFRNKIAKLFKKNTSNDLPNNPIKPTLPETDITIPPKGTSSSGAPSSGASPKPTVKPSESISVKEPVIEQPTNNPNKGQSDLKPASDTIIPTEQPVKDTIKSNNNGNSEIQTGAATIVPDDKKAVKTFDEGQKKMKALIDDLNSKNAEVKATQQEKLTQLADKLIEKYNIDRSQTELIHEIFADIFPEIQKYMAYPEMQKAILKTVTKENKEFLIKSAIPAISKHSETLDLQSKIEEFLKILSKDNVECLDLLAENAKKLKIESYTDVSNILKFLNNSNKDFAFNELFPLLMKEADKYRITRGSDLKFYIAVITPQNKDFMLNKVIPMLFESKSKTGIHFASQALSVAKHINDKNIIKLEELLKNAEPSAFKNDKGRFDAEKFVALLMPKQ